MAASSPRKRTPTKTAKPPRAPVDKALNESPTSVQDWKKGKAGEDLRLPSGNVCRVRRVGMREWVREDIIPDSLKPIVDAAISKGQNINPAKLKAYQTDVSKLGEMMELMDRVVALVVSKPVLIYHQQREDGEWKLIPEEDRDPEQLYTDEIDDEDKIFIFNFAAGGVRDLERFRQQLGSSVGAVRRGEDVEGSPE